MNQLDRGKGSDRIGVGDSAAIADGMRHESRWKIERYDADCYERQVRPVMSRASEALILAQYHYNRGDYIAWDYYMRLAEQWQAEAESHAYDVSLIPGNLLLNEGINEAWKLIVGAAATAYNNANARLVVGDSNSAEAATQTDLQAIRARTAWAASTAYALNSIVRKTAAPTDADVLYFEATVAGTSAATEPTWPTADGGTVVDGTVTWTARQRKFFKAMEAGYPTTGTQKATWRSVYAGTEANFAWNEFSVDNGAAAALNLNRKVSAQGTKISGQTWTLTLDITLS